MNLTLGVFARAPVPGRCKTRLARAIGNERAAAIYRAMLEDSLEAFGALPAARRVVLAAPEDEGVAALRALVPSGWEILAQEGGDLGERLAAALRALFPPGGSVAFLGSDSPTLPLGPVAEALARFAEPGRVLLGPCDDGGYYLVGLTLPEPGIFRDVPWSAPQVLSVTRRRCAELGLSVEELPSWYDVDDARDLERLGADLAACPERAPRTSAILGL